MGDEKLEIVIPLRAAQPVPCTGFEHLHSGTMMVSCGAVKNWTPQEFFIISLWRNKWPENRAMIGQDPENEPPM